jgi:hypothetical protein
VAKGAEVPPPALLQEPALVVPPDPAALDVPPDPAALVVPPDPAALVVPPGPAALDVPPDPATPASPPALVPPPQAAPRENARHAALNAIDGFGMSSLPFPETTRSRPKCHRKPRPLPRTSGNHAAPELCGQDYGPLSLRAVSLAWRCCKTEASCVPRCPGPRLDRKASSDIPKEATTSSLGSCTVHGTSVIPEHRFFVRRFFVRRFFVRRFFVRRFFVRRFFVRRFFVFREDVSLLQAAAAKRLG